VNTPVHGLRIKGAGKGSFREKVWLYSGRTAGSFNSPPCASAASPRLVSAEKKMAVLGSGVVAYERKRSLPLLLLERRRIQNLQKI
jgi:hypothetical protein